MTPSVAAARDGYAQGWGPQLERCLYFVTKLDGLIFFFF